MSYPPDVQRVPDTFIHLKCNTVISWSPDMTGAYGELAEQGCDCESLEGGEDNWRPVYAGQPVKQGARA
jgi:hypothetical protein